MSRSQTWTAPSSPVSNSRTAAGRGPCCCGQRGNPSNVPSRRPGWPRDDIVVTVLGTPGIPDVASGTVHRAPNLPGWERRGLLHELVSTLGADGSEVIVENDANLCAVGEHALGAARGVDVVACLTVGTGIGMGILVNGKLFRGAHGAAGEIADLPYDRVPAGVTAHRPGPVEIVAAAQAVVSAAHEAGLSRVHIGEGGLRLGSRRR